MFEKNDSGIVLVGAILLMFILVVLGQAMTMFVQFEATREIRGRRRESALYIADAGIERAIHIIKGGLTSSPGWHCGYCCTFCHCFSPRPIGSTTSYSNFIENIGLRTGSKAGQVVVNITPLGNNRYRIDSTGYVPSTDTARGIRRIRAEVKVGRGVPNEAVTAGGKVSLNSNIDVFGIIFSNGPIDVGSNVTLRPDSNRNAALRSASRNTTLENPAAIDIGSNFRIDPDNKSTKEEIRARGEVDGNCNTDPNRDIIAGAPPVFENDTTDKTAPRAELSFIDEQAILDSVKPQHINYDFGGRGRVNLKTGRVRFGSNVDIFLNNGVYLFRSGVEFNSNINFHGKGTIIVDTTYGSGHSGNYAYGIEFNSNIRGATRADHAQVNFIVLNGNWRKRDIKFNSNVRVEGLMQGAADIKANSNIHIKGIVIAGGDFEMNSNITIEYREPVFALPSKTAGGVTLLSWREIK